jgi:hypothetical protein
MTALQQPNLVAATPRYSCHWHKASDGALVMTWSPAEAGRPALDIVNDNLNSPRPDAVPSVPAIGFWKKAQLRTRAVAEHFAIVLLLGGSVLLTVATFMAEHNDLL